MKYDVEASSLRLYVIKNFYVGAIKNKRGRNMCSRNEMSPIEMEALTNTIRGMSEDQLRIVAQNMPVRIMCDEISNRYEVLADKFNSITSIMSNLN